MYSTFSFSDRVSIFSNISSILGSSVAVATKCFTPKGTNNEINQIKYISSPQSNKEFNAA